MQWKLNTIKALNKSSTGNNNIKIREERAKLKHSAKPVFVSILRQSTKTEFEVVLPIKKRKEKKAPHVSPVTKP